MNELGKRIAKKCIELKITPKDLAGFAEIKYSTLNSMMNAENPNPTLQNMKRLSIALGTSLDYLTFGEAMDENEDLKILFNDLKEIDKTDKKRILYIIRMMIAESKNK
ncbi:helix-turn-helix domain-containing protein [Moraxella macacae 0408225]|uniref:Helix-turn-helix domain-containing protein n=1 Tax=Moraxella macacae 0408225 TaxID=1230338 RepID=L2F682_9GAMM|nr:helix-turn-helix transcriptional regulator [Moraxella macacae]ELA08296.1 helix-turn-helix domain-containing protein [Moraxella macacae 0408225]